MSGATSWCSSAPRRRLGELPSGRIARGGGGPAFAGAAGDLCRALTAAFLGGSRGAVIRDLLAGYAEQATDWRTFAHFLPDGYARNLVHKTAEYELLVLCWEEGTESPIHDHMGQDCWMAVLEGEIEEVQFEEPVGKGAPPRRGSRTFARGEVAYIHDDIALHLVRPVGGAGISLHLYARPYDRCHVFCADTGRITDKVLAYHSVAGVPIEPPTVR